MGAPSLSLPTSCPRSQCQHTQGPSGRGSTGPGRHSPLWTDGFGEDLVVQDLVLWGASQRQLCRHRRVMGWSTCFTVTPVVAALTACLLMPPPNVGHLQVSTSFSQTL